MRWIDYLLLPLAVIWALVSHFGPWRVGFWLLFFIMTVIL